MLHCPVIPCSFIQFGNENVCYAWQRNLCSLNKKFIDFVNSWIKENGQTYSNKTVILSQISIVGAWIKWHFIAVLYGFFYFSQGPVSDGYDMCKVLDYGFDKRTKFRHGPLNFMIFEEKKLTFACKATFLHGWRMEIIYFP